MKETILTLMDVLYRMCIWTSGISLFVMTIVIPIGVFNRYVLGHGSMWPEPLAILCMIIFTFFGAAAGYRAGAHIAVTMVTDRIPPGLQKFFSQLVDVLMIALALFVARYGFSLCMVTWDQYIAEFPVLRVGLTYLPLPIGSVITVLFVIERIAFGPQHLRKIVRIGSPGSENDNHSTDGE
ncbi:TRAP transporter small permease [Desulfopila aestuarii]|uniref:TRAP-type C4-dicarboxylate transport system, small permease component n=1 Tax=Desulfopila aestuarii DSM 18488 TaxID=1121416 RepID=A0A1M7YEW7_9BACT|nr:TRAP transporter small permease [Desulfopila aestuarii]SHO51153.1 TRAP-type C4-dicarboxylate transport system, small permease component [Desulfopila aestuarii DSM 18488]